MSFRFQNIILDFYLYQLESISFSFVSIMPRELAEIIKEAFPRLSDIAQQVGGNFTFKIQIIEWSDVNFIRSRK